MLNLAKGLLLSLVCALLAAPSAFGQTAIKLNEIQANNLSHVGPDGSITDWVELINTSGADVDLGGASLTDDDVLITKWVFPSGSIVPANGYLLVAFDPDRPASIVAESYLNTGFGMKSTGITLWLFSQNFDILDSVSFGNQIADYSIGRIAGGWTLCNPTPGEANTRADLGSPVGLKINEWMANPLAGDNDWFEIYNPGALPVSLDGLYLTDTLTVKTMFQIAPLSFIGSGLQAYATYIADGSTNKGPEHVSFSLKASGEAIGLFDTLGTQIDAVTFGAQAQGVSQGRLLDGSANITTFPGTPSPGLANYKAIPDIIVNELLSHTDPPIEDAVEFYNRGATDINIGGWFLSNKESELKKYRIPDGTIIKSHDFQVFYEGAFNNTNTAISPFTFNSAHGDQVYLSQADAAGNLTGYRVTELFEAAEHGVSFGRVETSVPGDYKFVAMSSLTFGVDNPTTLEEFRQGRGESNSLPKIGPVVFNEVNYNPAQIDPGVDNRDDEFIELYNITASPVLLYDPLHVTNHWRLQNGVTFVFPGGRSIPAHGYALVVSFDPVADPIGASNFRARWHVPSNVQIFGPFGGDLNNNGDSLELYKPDPPQDPPHPDAGFVPYIRVDKVNYTDTLPWPSGADGTGQSLQRKNPLTFGNDPINWSAAAPTPGAANSPDLLDTDGDGMTDTWEDAHGFNKNDPSDAAQDADNDGLTNFQEFIAGTDPHDATSRLQIKDITPAAGDAQPLTLTFNAVAGKAYSVQFRSDFAISSDWKTLTDVPADSFTRDVTVQDANAALKTNRFYRISIQ